jgi:hypothetical protein
MCACVHVCTYACMYLYMKFTLRTALSAGGSLALCGSDISLHRKLILRKFWRRKKKHFGIILKNNSSYSLSNQCNSRCHWGSAGRPTYKHRESNIKIPQFYKTALYIYIYINTSLNIQFWQCNDVMKCRPTEMVMSELSGARTRKQCMQTTEEHEMELNSINSSNKYGSMSQSSSMLPIHIEIRSRESKVANLCRSQWPRGLRRRATAARLLRWWVRIPKGAWMFVCCVCAVCCQVEVSATSWSLVQRSPADRSASLRVIKKPSGWGGHSPRWAAVPEKKKVANLTPCGDRILTIYLSVELNHSSTHIRVSMSYEEHTWCV